MKTIENVTLYKCDFCKKELKRKHAMENHEKKCSNNPINSKACYSCVFLEEAKTNVSWVRHYDHGEGTSYFEKEVKCFKCTKLDKLMYSANIEKGSALIRYPETFENQEAMPKECEDFDDGFNF